MADPRPATSTLPDATADLDTGRHPLLGTWWVTAHVVVLAVLVTFPMLAAWQWERHREEQATAARIDERITSTPVPLAQVLTPAVLADFEKSDVAALEFTPVVVTGTWRGGEQVAQRNRSYGGQGGFDLLTPLVPGVDGGLDGMAVLVRRGWVPPTQDGSATPTDDVPVSGPVEVVGWLEAPVSQPSFGPTDAATGTLTTVFHADVDRLDDQVEGELAPMLVHLTTQSPDDGDLPLAQPVPEHDTTQNLSYALQWTAFTLIVGIGYAIVLRRRLRDRRAGIDSDVDPYLRDAPSAQSDDRRVT